jgi:hypothetical protein
VTISDAGIFTDSSNYLKNTLCGAIPHGAAFMYYFESSSQGYFVLGSGRLWAFDKYDALRVTSGSAYPLPNDVFIAGYQEGNLYAAAANGVLQVRGGSGIHIDIPGQDDYHYQVAFAPSWTRFFALGSRYGSIHIWTLP